MAQGGGGALGIFGLGRRGGGGPAAASPSAAADASAELHRCFCLPLPLGGGSVPSPQSCIIMPAERMSRVEEVLDSEDPVAAHVAELRRLVEDQNRRLQHLEAELLRGPRDLEAAAAAVAAARLPAAKPSPASASRPARPRDHSPRMDFTQSDSSGKSGRSAKRAASKANNPYVHMDSWTSLGFVDSVRDEDPYDQMWSAAKLDQQRIWDQDHLKSIYEKPYRKNRQNAALIGGGVVGILSMPFGPIGMAGGGMLGALIGGIAGIVADRRKRSVKMKELEEQKKRLHSLVRWATERLHEEGEILKLIEMVTLEFKPVAEVAEKSKNARRLLKLLDEWIAQKSVTRELWVYMDKLLKQWHDLSRGEFLRSMMVFETLTSMYNHSRRVLDDQEMQFLQRMKRLLDHDSVKSVMVHAKQYPTMGNKRVMECMVYADAEGPRRLSSKSAPKSPTVQDTAREGDAEDSDEDPVAVAPEESITYQYATTPTCTHVEQSRKPALVLKKPFFRNWDDFMEFDMTFKHKMPINLSEFELLLQKEAESTKGWDVPVDRKDIKVAKVQSGVGGVTLRAWGTVPGVDIHVAFFLFYDVNERTKWDTAFGKMAIIEPDLHGSDILYSLLKVPGVTQRDFLQYRRVKVQDDGSIVIVLRSAEHPDVPEDRRYIRAESHISGYVLRQSYDERGGKVLNIFLMSCSDVKGMIPKWIINYFAPKKPGEWIEALRKAAQEYQAKNPNYKDELQERMKMFMGSNPFDFEPEGGEVFNRDDPEVFQP